MTLDSPVQSLGTRAGFVGMDDLACQERISKPNFDQNFTYTVIGELIDTN